MTPAPITATHLLGLLAQREARCLLLDLCPGASPPESLREWEATRTDAERAALAEYQQRVAECLAVLREGE